MEEREEEERKQRKRGPKLKVVCWSARCIVWVTTFPSQVTSSYKPAAGQKRKAEGGDTPKGRTKRKRV